ncbi:MAG: hypothetical protein Q9219_004672 [cf. Caloplaca sp. 3 TL-2023]
MVVGRAATVMYPVAQVAQQLISDVAFRPRHIAPADSLPRDGMKLSFTSSQISRSNFTHALQDYPKHVSSDLKPLNDRRYHEIPASIAQREKDGKPILDKEELQDLVEWKLKHGTYRPSLAKLVASNSAEAVRSTTASAFSLFAASEIHDPSKAIATLCTLRGIGPATASLILACYDAVRVPFFSDELFRWMHWEDGEVSSNGGSKKRKAGSEKGGWERKIKYTAKEYLSLFDKVRALSERLGSEIKAVDIERVARVIERWDAVGWGEVNGEKEGRFGAEGSDEEKEEEAERDVGPTKRRRTGK